MIVRLSLRSLVRRRSRTALALAGIAVAAALLLDMTMLASGLTDSFAALMRSRGYQLRVTPRGTLPFDSEAGIAMASSVASRIREIPGVEAVAPVLGAQLYLVRGEGHEPVFTLGVDPGAQMLYLLDEGREPGAGEAVVSLPLAAEYDLRVGDSLRVAAELDPSLGRPRDLATLRVSGLGDFLYDYAGQHSFAMPLAEVQRFTGRPDEVSLFGVAIREDLDDGPLARRMEAAISGVSVYSTAELLAAMNQRLLYFRQLAAILGIVSLAVTALLISTIVTIGIRERFGELVTLRAIGVARRRLLLGIVAEGLALALAGCALGFPLGLWMARRLDAILLAFPGIPAKLSFFVFDPTRVALGMGIVILAGALSGLVPGTFAVRAALGRALREEAE